MAMKDPHCLMSAPGVMLLVPGHWPLAVTTEAGPEAELQLTAVWAGVIIPLQSRLQTAECLVCRPRQSCTGGRGPVSQRDLHSVTVYNPASILLLSHKPDYQLQHFTRHFDTHIDRLSLTQTHAKTTLTITLLDYYMQ